MCQRGIRRRRRQRRRAALLRAPQIFRLWHMPENDCGNNFIGASEPMGQRDLIRKRGGVNQSNLIILWLAPSPLCVEMGFYTDISWDSRCNIEINYKILLVFEVSENCRINIVLNYFGESTGIDCAGMGRRGVSHESQKTSPFLGVV